MRAQGTERLRLEPVCRAHLEDLVTMRSDPRVAEWFLEPMDRSSALRSISDAEEAWRRDGFGPWSAYLMGGASFVGQGGARWCQVEGEPVVEVGWSLSPSFWGNGYATEIGRAGIDLAFERTDVAGVVAYTLPGNRRSRAVMERLGMSYARDVEHAGHRHVLYSLDRPGLPSPPGAARSSGG